jgi:hypothetical protein
VIADQSYKRHASTPPDLALALIGFGTLPLATVGLRARLQHGGMDAAAGDPARDHAARAGGLAGGLYRVSSMAACSWARSSPPAERAWRPGVVPGVMMVVLAMVGVELLVHARLTARSR